MKLQSSAYLIRKTHRYLGIFIGIQFLAWTVGGLYFSWTNIDRVHGDFERHPVPLLKGNISVVSPGVILKHITNLHTIDSIKSLELLNILQRPSYSLSYYSQGELRHLLADAQTGVLREPVSEKEAMRIAEESFTPASKVKSVEYITEANAHHEYRENPLPAWAVTFDHPSKTTVYVSANFGRVEEFRNAKWRVFDFLWMMHSMGYQDRDKINNRLLQIFSITGLITVLSGFTLFIVSSPILRYWFRKKNRYKSH